MSMTFTQLLYIDFTKESSQKNFDDEKFEELLLKIKEHAQPTLQIVPTSEQSKVSLEAAKDNTQNESAPSGVEDKKEEKVEPQILPEPEANVVSGLNDKQEEPTPIEPNDSEKSTMPEPASDTSSPAAAPETQEVPGTNQVPQEDGRIEQQTSPIEPVACEDSKETETQSAKPTQENDVQPREPHIESAPTNDDTEKTSRPSSAGKKNKKSKSCLII